MPDDILTGPAAPVTMRAVDDIPAIRTNIYSQALQAAQKIEPITNQLHTLTFKDAHYADPEQFSIARRKQAILQGQTLGRRLRGTWELTDNATGKVIDRRTSTLATIPHLTDHGTFILNGSGWTIAHQSRLRPGIYTRTRSSGEPEAHINMLPGAGLSTHKVFLDPKSGVFKVQVRQAEVPLLPLLRSLGATNTQLKEAWGEGTLRANADTDQPRHLSRLYERLVSRAQPGLDLEQQKAALVKAIQEARLDETVTGRTLKKPHAQLSLDAYLDATKRVLGVHRGEEEEDDRDHPAYQHVLGPEDIIAERFNHAARHLRPMLRKATFTQSLRSVPVGALDRAVRGAFLETGLGQALEEIGPADVLDQVTRITRLGEGAIADPDAIPEESRGLNAGQLGYIDAVRTPESLSAGVDLRLAHRTYKGSDGRLYADFHNVRTGKEERVSPQDLADKVIAFPGELDGTDPWIRAVSKGRLQYVKRDEVDYALPDMERSFNHLASLIPLKSASKGQRVSMGSRMSVQALPLSRPEAPLVQAGVPGAHYESYEHRLGERMGAIRAPGAGKVDKVDDQGITVRYDDGTTQTHELYNWLPLNRKSSLHNRPVVRPGDRVQAGQTLAASNFTDDAGTTALGANLRVAYLPYRAHNIEDAWVISQSAAQKLAADTMYQHDVEWDARHKRGKKAFQGLFPGIYDRKTLDTLDDDGLIKPGTLVQQGHPLILAAKERDKAHNQIGKGSRSSFQDETVTWDHHTPGIVTDAVQTPKGALVTVRASVPVQDGDKVSGRYGDKGVVAKILPDEQMPRDAQGQPFDILANPLGVITRANPSQIVEAALGKIAARTGQPYKPIDFQPGQDWMEYARRELKHHNLTDTEEVTDPETGVRIPGILTGVRYFMRLHHMAESKAAGRGASEGYTGDDQPAKGGASGAKRLSLADINAIVSHGAIGVLQDRPIRGQKNLDWWAAFMEGRTPPAPRVPLVYEKFLAMLKAAGINPLRRGSRTQLLAMTDQDVDELAGDRELQNTDTVDYEKGLKELKGGLFDPELTGGHGGNRYAKITLAEPLPNPVFEDPIRRLLGLTAGQLEDVLSGQEKLGDKTGPQAIQERLAQIKLPEAIRDASARVRNERGAKRDQAIRQLGYLKAAERTGLHPRDWMLTKVPVLPPKFRPVALMQNKRPLVADPNFTYKDLFDANQTLKEMQGRVADTGAERLALYQSLKAVVGLGDPVTPAHAEKGVRGLLKHILGSNAKFSMLHRKILSGTVDTVGRSVIAPDPDLDLDEIGVPENQAWDVFKPFVIRNLTRHGVSPLDAARQVKDQTPLAKRMLLQTMQERPVIAVRAPVLHRYNVMAFRPQLTSGDTLRVNSFILKGYAGDFDGNCIVYGTVIGLELYLPSLYASPLGRDFMSQLEEKAMRLTGEHRITISRDENHCVVTLPIGEFPALGTPQIGRRHERIYEVPAGVRILTYDHESGAVRYDPITRFTVDENHPCERVTTARGRTVEVSSNESLCVFDVQNGSIKRSCPQTGMTMPFVRREPIRGTKYTAALGWWYGSFVSDGWTTPRTVGYAKLDDSQREAFIRIARQEICENFIAHTYRGSADVQKLGDSAKVHLNGSDLVQKVFSCIDPVPEGQEPDRTALRKRLPKELLDNGSRDCLLGLLAGLLEGDGTLGWNRHLDRPRLNCRYSTSSKMLVADICRLARRLGLRTGVVTSPPRGHSKESYTVCFSTVDVLPLLPSLPFVTAAAKQLAREIGDHPKRNNADAVDIVPVTLDLAAALSKVAQQVRPESYSVLRKALLKGHVSRETALNLLAVLPADFTHPHLEEFRRIANNHDVHWDKVDKVEAIKPQTVYDLEVPSTKVFAIDNGLIIWDTMSWHVPVTEAAVKDAYDKMLPSQNLFSARNFKAHQLPINEIAAGLYQASTAQSEGPELTFATAKDALQAYKQGRIGLNAKVRILQNG